VAENQLWLGWVQKNLRKFRTAEHKVNAGEVGLNDAGQN